jgi:hypothetical protein
VWRHRFVYSALFFLGTFLAGAGWLAELRDYPIDLTFLTIGGHLLQIIGAFGHMLTPESIDDEEDGNKSL